MTVVRAVRIALLVLAGWMLVGVVLGVLAVRDVQRGIDAARAARTNLSPEDLVAGRPVDDLERARTAFASGHDKTAGVGMAPLRLLPVVGRHVRSIAALSDAAATVARVGIGAVGEAKVTLDRPQDTGPSRVQAVEDIAATADRALDELDGLELGPTNLFAPLASRRADFESQLDEVRVTLRRTRDAGEAVGALLRGPRTYLLVAANNAEMRAGSGMFLSIGTLDVVDGGFRLGALEPAGELTLSEAQAPPLTGDLAARWGWLTPNREWRNLMTSPRFDENAALAAAMWHARTGVAVDGVLAVDAEALRGVLAATGPVPLPDRVLDDRAVLGYVLHDQYAEYGDELNPETQAPRREQLGHIATAAVGAIQSGDFEVARLAKELAGAVAGRHLMAWSARSDEQRGWVAAGVAGSVGPNSVMAAVINRGGNKLDWFMPSEASVDIDPGRDATEVRVRLTVRNTTPEGEVRYVAGPYPGSGVGAGVYTGLVAFTLPGGAQGVRIEGVDTVAVAGADGPTRVIAVAVTIERGASRIVEARFHLPGAHGMLTVEPNGRIPPTAWSAGGEAWSGGRGRTLRW